MQKLIATVAVLVVELSHPRIHAPDVASMTGIIPASTGTVVAGVQVELTNPAIAVTYKAVTNSAGSHTIAAAQPGPAYSARFSRDRSRSVVQDRSPAHIELA